MAKVATQRFEPNANVAGWLGTGSEIQFKELKKTSRDLDRFTVDTTCTLKNEEKLMEYHS